MATFAPEVPVLARDEAFEELYRQYVKDVYHYALALLRNPADAEDVTQTTFLNAYRAFQRGEEIRKPQNWLIKIAHNVARSRYARVSRRVKEVPLEDHVDQLAVPEDEKPNVEGVLRALGRLPFNQRAALVMRELEGRTYTEIADTLGVSVAAVETLIFRARRSLRIRTAALRSILAVPLPTSLTQFFESGGGAAAGGIGAGFLIKAAVALVVGGLATGLGAERATRAAGAPAAQGHPSVAASMSATAGGNAVRHMSVARGGHVRRVSRRAALSGRVVGTGVTRRTSFEQPSSAAPAASSGSHVQAQTSAGPSSAVVPPVAATATKAVQTVGAKVQQTADQAAATVAAALPVDVAETAAQAVATAPLPHLP